MSKRKTIMVFGKKYREVEADQPEETYFRYFVGPTAELREYPYSGPLYRRVGWYARLLDGRFNTDFPSENPIGAIERLEDRLKLEIETRLPEVLASLREEDDCGP